MSRRTKIVATIGPASDSPNVLQAMVTAGMDMARVSLAHDSIDDTLARIHRVRDASATERRHVGVLADLPGPKVRAAEFPEGGVHLVEDAVIQLVPSDGGGDRSAAVRIAVDHPTLTAEVRAGDRLALGDGAIQ